MEKSSDTKSCGFCRTERVTSTLKRCTGCQAVSYCNAECQRQDWKIHKTLCKEIRAQAEKFKIETGSSSAPVFEVQKDTVKLQKRPPNAPENALQWLQAWVNMNHSMELRYIECVAWHVRKLSPPQAIVLDQATASSGRVPVAKCIMILDNSHLPVVNLEDRDVKFYLFIIKSASGVSAIRAEDVAPLRLFYTPETLASYDDTEMLRAVTQTFGPMRELRRLTGSYTPLVTALRSC